MAARTREKGDPQEGGGEEKRVPGEGSAAAVRRARPKIGDVARRAGVSLGTVSAVLNGNGRVSEATRLRVQQTIGELGYQPDLYASNLARHQTRFFGVVISNLQNPFFAETAQAVEEEAARQGYQTSLMATNFSQERHRAAVMHLLGARIAGLAVLTSEQDSVSRALVRASGIPAVFLDAGTPEERMSTLRVDSRGGMRAAVEHLLGLGHRRLLYVQNSQQESGAGLFSHRQRLQGFRAAVRGCGLPDLYAKVVDVRGPGAEAGEEAVRVSFAAEGFSGVIAMTDAVAIGVYRGLQARGLSVPAEVSVVGFDNTDFSRYLQPPLTTVDLSRSELSRMVVESLLGREGGRTLTLPARLIYRGSTQPPRVGAALVSG